MESARKHFQEHKSAKVMDRNCETGFLEAGELHGAHDRETCDTVIVARGPRKERKISERYILHAFSSNHAKMPSAITRMIT